MTAVDRIDSALRGVQLTPEDADIIITLVRHRATRPGAPFSFHPSSDGRPLTLEEVIGQAIGAASVCWENMSGTGVFNDTRARAISDALLAHIQAQQPDKVIEQLRRYLERFEGGSGTAGQNAVVDAINRILDGEQVRWAPSDMRTPEGSPDA